MSECICHFISKCVSSMRWQMAVAARRWHPNNQRTYIENHMKAIWYSETISNRSLHLNRSKSSNVIHTYEARVAGDACAANSVVLINLKFKLFKSKRLKPSICMRVRLILNEGECNLIFSHICYTFTLHNKCAVAGERLNDTTNTNSIWLFIFIVVVVVWVLNRIINSKINSPKTIQLSVCVSLEQLAMWYVCAWPG